MNASASPEDKLLRLIKTNRLAGLPAGRNRVFAGFGGFKLGYVLVLSRILFAVVLIISLFTTVKAVVYPRKVDMSAPAGGRFVTVSAKPFSFYQGAMTRKIFDAPAEVAAAPDKPQGPLPADIIANLNLAGIVAGETPKAVIEDKKAAKSYFLREGESLGEIKVDKIGSGKVVLDLQGEKFELVL